MNRTSKSTPPISMNIYRLIGVSQLISSATASPSSTSITAGSLQRASSSGWASPTPTYAKASTSLAFAVRGSQHRPSCKYQSTTVRQLFLLSSSTPTRLTSVNAEVDEEDDVRLTPGTYATSSSAERQVDNEIEENASMAFASTDKNEPHLSPELKDAEVAYEVALAASAAHAMADAAMKESKQSMAASLEREKEMQWIQNHEDEVSVADKVEKSKLAEKNQRALLEARFAMENKTRQSKAEQNQRALLEARFEMENKAKVQSQTKVEEEKAEEQMDWMESEARAATMGGHEMLSINVASAAASASLAAAHAFAEVEEEEESTVPVGAASMLAETAERMILGEDIAFEQAAEKEEYDTALVPIVEPEELTVLRKHVQQIAIEETKNKLLKKNGNDEDNTAGIASSEAEGEKQTTEFNKGDNAIKRALENGVLRRVKHKRRLLAAALILVLSRRLVLLFAGNASRLL